MRINWRVRAKNPYFWVGLIAVILAAVGVSPESLTSWSILYTQIIALIQNPFAIGCVIIALLGYINDPTTKGISDSDQAMTYQKPKADKQKTIPAHREGVAADPAKLWGGKE